MITKRTGLLQRLIDFVLDVPPTRSRAERRYLIIGRAGLPLGAIAHGGLTIVFWWLGVMPLFWFNVISAAFWIFACWHIYHRSGVKERLAYWPFVLCIMVEIPAHALLATWLLGSGPGFTVYILVAIPIVSLTHIFSLSVKALITGLMGGLFVLANVYAHVVGPMTPLSETANLAFLAFNGTQGALVLIVVLLFYDAAAQSMERDLEQAHDRAERLLRNILPEEIAERLKAAPDVIADEHPDATILFADIVGFTEASARMAPADLVKRLNRVFSAFDELAEKHGVEKIKTIGDAYMAVAGLPTPRPDHARVMVILAQEMLTAVEAINAEGDHEPVRIRIGVNSGPVIAGVIGQSKFAYDLWGDAVNVAARMEEACTPGEVLMTEATRAGLGDSVPTTDEGLVAVKGKGEMRVYSLCA